MQQENKLRGDEEGEELSLEQRLLRIPSRVLQRLRGKVQAPVQEQRFEKEDQDQDQEQEQQQMQGVQRQKPQSAFRAVVGNAEEKNIKDNSNEKDNEYDDYEDEDDDDEDSGGDDELEDEDEQQGQDTGSGADKMLNEKATESANTKDKEKEKLFASVIQLAQFDSTSSRRPKAIDSARIPIEYSPSEVAFVGQVGIGTPNQYFNLEFDIGSSDTWVTSARANCSQNQPCSTTARRGFHIERSSTFESAPNISWHLELSDGPAVAGRLGTDVVQVAGFVVDRQVIGIADSLTGVKENGIDGSFGLGLTDLTFNGDPTPVETLINANAMHSEVGVWLGSGNQGGELTFGGQDKSRYNGSLSYYSVPPGSAYWSLPIHSLTVITDKNIEFKDKIPRNKRTIDQVDSRSGTGTGISVPNVIFDTSTNIILVPPRIALKTHQLIHDFFFGWYSGYNIFLGLYTVSCDLRMVDLWFDLGSQAVSLSPTPDTVVNNNNQDIQPSTHTGTLSEPDSSTTTKGDISSQTASFTKGNITTTGEWTSENKFRVRGQDLVRERVPIIGGIFNICFSGIQASKNDEDDWVFGNLWFMNNYMTLDHRHRLIGIAPAVQS
ncbi:hypothetical protein BGZ96_009473 [Linnemannia gamsii]|uniref:Peptidase A1 domain-containing protein n=1 Tax=Linnemannia gamsii TaxID=64522 RepID=A0ABQ7JWN8_9FUNG|nr:hypothetical protein BGZ96_009473 [Linnemannia gamsii]